MAAAGARVRSPVLGRGLRCDLRHAGRGVRQNRWPAFDGRAHRHLAFRSEEHTSELQSQSNLVCRLLLEKKKTDNSLYNFRNIGSIKCRQDLKIFHGIALYLNPPIMMLWHTSVVLSRIYPSASLISTVRG